MVYLTNRNTIVAEATKDYKPGPVPMPTDLELWMAGQSTLTEQLVEAAQRFFYDMPLQHNSDTAVPRDYAVTPPALVGEPAQPTLEELNMHVTIWLAAVYCETEVVDMELPRPLSLAYMKEALVNACSVTPEQYDDLYPTVPQLGDYYGSFIAQPAWLKETAKRVLVIDTRALGGTAYAVYFDGRVNHAGIRHNLPEYLDAQLDFYLFGSLTPLLPGHSMTAITGGVIKVVPQGRHCTWSDSLDLRLEQPARWSSEVSPPTQLDGLYNVFQSTQDQVVDEIEPLDFRSLEAVADEVLELGQADVTAYLPEERLQALSHGGRSIWEQVAVLHNQTMPAGDFCVIFVDLRPLACFPQWVRTPEIFDPQAYIDDLQIPGLADWVLTVVGGEPMRQGKLRVRHREVLIFSLQRPTESEETSEEDGESEDDGDGDDNSTEDMFCSGSSTPPPPPGPGEPPRGPPPPRPMNRSRSPRRNMGTRGEERTTTSRPTLAPPLALCDLVGPPSFDMTRVDLLLPHDPIEVAALFAPWPWESALLNLDSMNFKPPTNEAIKGLVTWDELLSLIEQHGLDTELHAYTDGSWRAKQGLGGYAVVLLWVTTKASAICHVLGDQVQGNPGSPWSFTAPPALMNEQIAIAVTLLWLLSDSVYSSFSKILLHFDCYAAGWSAQGSWSPVNAFSKQIRDLERLLQKLVSVPLHFVHTKAHVGHPYNEMADVCANEAATASAIFHKPPPDVCRILQEGDLSWLSVAFDYGVLPVQAGRYLSWSGIGPTGPSHLLPEQLIPTTVRGGLGRQSAIEFKVLTLNAQSLNGKCRYYEDQLDAMGINLALFQEVMGGSGVCSSRRFLRLSTDSAKHWGVALWVSKKRGLLSSNGYPQPVQEEDIQVVFESPRLLILSIRAADCRIFAVSGHCPHNIRKDEAKQFHDDLSYHLGQIKEAGIVVVGVDLNGRVPTGIEGVTGGLEHGDPDDNGRAFVATAELAGIWLPATYHEYHNGTSTTYRQANGAEHRIDYIGIEGCLKVTEISSWVEQDFDTANVNDDHSAVVLDVTGSVGGTGFQKRLHRPKYDTGKMLTKEGKAIIEKELAHYSPPSWETHPDDHCQHLQDFMHDIMKRHFSLEAGRPKASYIPHEVWKLREGKLGLKRRTRHRKDLSEALLSRAFLQWKTGEDYGVLVLLRKQLVLYELTAGAVRWATGAIKRGIAKAKAAFLQGLAFSEGDKGGDVLHKAKAAGIGGRQARPISRPLPSLKMHNGDHAASWEDRDKVWMEHFGAQEMGQTENTADFLNATHHGIYRDEEINWTVGDIPTIQELEESLRMAPRNKAPGLDGVPGELLSATPSAMSTALYPLIAKSVLQLHQPVQWRGGILQESWKRNGPIDNPANYRSLFISSQVGKCFHKLLRRRAGPIIETALHDFHLGARRQAPVVYPALYIHGFLRRAKQLRHSASVLFLDTQAAYYRVIRELAVGHVGSDMAVARVFRFFDIGSEEMHEFADLIKQGGMFDDAGFSAWQRGLRQHYTCWITPGRVMADVIFSFVLSKILLQIMEQATAENLLTELTFLDNGGIYETAGQGKTLQAKDCTWADDSAFPLSDPDPHRLLAKTSRMGSLIIDYCQRHGMAPNLRPKKTAIILAVRGKGSQRARKQWFPHGAKSIHLRDLDLKIQVAGQYVHLGGLVDADLKMMGEARRRLSMAKASFDSGKALLYTNMSIPLSVRASLFATSVTSTFFNLALWVEEGEAWTKLEVGFSNLLRGLLAKTYKGELLYRVLAPVVHVVTGVPPLAYLARKARLSLLCSMASFAPLGLWAVLQEERTWLRQVSLDLQWLVEGDERWPSVGGDNWPEWSGLLASSTTWVKRQVKAKIQRDMRAFQGHTVTMVCLWAIWRRAAAPDQAERKDAWVCRMCDKRVKTRAALGAHFFKTHKRLAKHRAYVHGTRCQACGREFWCRNRLAIHVRDAPSCVQKLHEAKLTVDAVAPGLGSKKWRQQADEDYTLATSKPMDEPMPEVRTDSWHQPMLQAHRDLSDLLTNDKLPPSAMEIRQLIEDCMAKHPLYSDEMDDLASYLLQEAGELHQAEAMEGWSEVNYEALTEALRQFSGAIWSADGGAVDDAHTTTLRDFQQMVDTIDWPSLCRNTEDLNETPKARLRLPEGWEAALNSGSGLADVAAVQGSYWPVVPEALRVAWDAARTGAAVQLCAPEDFWRRFIYSKTRDVCEELACGEAVAQAPNVKQGVAAMVESSPSAAEIPIFVVGLTFGGIIARLMKGR
ncbi:hypothetical protein AK812_SmicGene40723 [Symbiodinium microadriaticum]|uniref:RNase H type-1 domain-containing protein n=1 Tax=Symbiodinium microadriaticum TaxID=2951 RepID=A0A1Q9C7Y7_SYMMI|nr:hypothetical protein AK812_SmicGene40723 [Symbiodinium microadriaticum]